MIKLQKDAKDKEFFTLDLAPMINIVFLLLIFFLLTSTAIKQGDAIDLPNAESSKKNEEEENIVISVGVDQKLQLDRQEIQKSDLVNSLVEKLKGHENKVVVIEGDKKIEFALFGEILDIAKQAGATDFILATEPINL
jgi:biopolymer transport protein ExbD